MKKITIYCVFLFALILSSCKTKQNIAETPQEPKPVIQKTGFRFVENSRLMPLLDQAEQEGKLVFVDFYTTWCLPCKMMDDDVFPDKELADFFNANFINFKVNAEVGHGMDLGAIFEIKSYPTLLFLNAKGRILERKNGAAYHSELRSLAESALEKEKNGEG